MGESVNGREGHGAAYGFGGPQAMLEAGAVLPLHAATAPEPGSDIGDKDRSVALTARSYGHPALEERTVVRLVPEAIGPAEDLALEYLGFSGGESVAVGRVKPQSLGFPAWALVHDPQHGHHALAVVKEMERLTRLVGTKPGLAKEGFDEIGQRLDRSVPQFLPTFYEQVGRLFLAVEAQQQASVFFGKARAAEQRHALPVDEERLRDVFLEFAGAGALSGKALREYAKGLGERLPPSQAYTEFRVVSSQRCSAGLTPYAGMLEDLRRLARGAGLDAAAEERSLLKEIVHTGAMNRAAGSFWKSALPALTVVAAEDAAIRERLLNLLPETSGDHTEEFDRSWLSLLEACGAFELLLDGTVPVADWLTAWSAHRHRGWRGMKRLDVELDLVARLADRLKADGTPVKLLRGGWRTSVDLDVLDLCLSLGIPVEPPEYDMAGLELDGWLSDRSEGRRDLAALVADPRFAQILRSGVERLAGTGDSAAQRLLPATGYPALCTVIAAWLTDRAEELTRSIGLPALSELLQRLSGFASRPALSTAPDALARITAFSPAGALARTLRSGVWDELGWAAFDEALAKLGKVVPKPAKSAKSARRRDDEEVKLSDAWPALVVRRGSQAAAVGPEAVVDSQPLTFPSSQPNRSWSTPVVRYVGGQWLTINGYGDECRGRWSGRGADAFTPDGTPTENYLSHRTPSLELPDGSRTFGGRPVHAGDTSFDDVCRPVASDGISLWVLHEHQWWDYDPQSARRGRLTVPAFFDSALSEGTGAVLLERYCQLLPARAGLESSPFGSAHGVVGWWVRFDPTARTLTACSTDGTRSLPVEVAGAAKPEHLNTHVPLPPMRLPGGAVLHPRESRSYQSRFDFFDADGVRLATVTQGEESEVYAGGTPLIPPLGYWHALRPRDERGSLVLRAVTDELAAELLKTVVDGRQPAEAVRELLPGITHPGLVAGVAALVGEAARQAGQIATLSERAAQAEPDARPTVRYAHDGPLREALNSLLSSARFYGRWYSSWDESGNTVMGQLAALRSLLEPGSGDAKLSFDEPGVNWLSLSGLGLAAAAVRAASPVTSEADRNALLEFLDAALAVSADGEAVLIDPRGRLRIVELKSPWDLSADVDTEEMLGTVRHSGARRLLVISNTEVEDDHAVWSCVEYDPAGTFGPWEGYSEIASDVLGSADDPIRAAAVRRLIDTTRKRGPLPYYPQQAQEFADRVGASPVVGALLQLGLPGLDSYGRDGLLSAQYLAPLGLKSADAKAGRAHLEVLSARDRQRFTGLLLPLEPARVDALWTDGFAAEPLIEAWVAARGKRRVAPSWLVSKAIAETGPGTELDSALNPEAQPELTGTTEQRIGSDGVSPVEREKLLTGQTLVSYVRMLRWLAYRLPLGDPLREILPITLRMLRTRLADPGLLLDLGLDWDDQGKATSVRLREAHGHGPRGSAAKDGGCEVSDTLVLTPMKYRPQWDSVWVRSAPLVTGEAAGPDHPDLKLLAGIAGESDALVALRLVLGAELMALLTHDGPAGAAQCPARSAPELVPLAAERLGISEDAATLYLMMLALPDPTDKNQAEWTGWKPARLKKARAEVAATDLVVEGKRARAGRSLFLPGGWLEHKAPRLPLESWKTALLPDHEDGFLAPDRPVGELFTAAWQRVVNGDAPGFEEFKGRNARGGSR
ncbi:hypothetical protein [Streptomyces albipurpureus]|uniref:DNA-binding protein n=1 Tax=Streptomyces albipurpureus TaxID=2897419 RepID=A0ABT0UJC9_9ACTN|nr:hypothetical protein [Streptomyces sp. CWNU-1]MCM2388545.1 hypothetical protein [Streptomyces sp. CWNU-1]